MSFRKDLKILFKTYLIFLTVFLIHRFIFWILFKDTTTDISLIAKSWWVGFRFDLRVITLFLLIGLGIFACLGMIFNFFLKNKNNSVVSRLIYKIYFSLQIFYVSMGLLFFTVVFWVDIGNYSYLDERLTSKIFALLSNPSIALGMVAQSYPIYIIIPALLLVIWLFYMTTSKILFSSKGQPESFFALDSSYKRADIGKFFLALFVMASMVHSKLSQYPLRWSEAYFSKNHFINQFALNPVQNIFDTYKFAKSNYTFDSVKEDLELVKRELGIERSSNEFLVRYQKPNPIPELKNIKNVVVIMMESLAAFKLGAYGAPLHTSPNFDVLAKESLLFENFHVVQTGTAASIFCFITSIPDLNEEETASRNPLVVDQHTIINNFKDHDKFYFIGGDANWGNIRGVIKNNIHDVHLLEEKDFKKASKTDIWGISDLELFNQANQILEQQKNPFFAFIQTAGYHRPYTIPKNREGFESKSISDQEIKDYGFASQDEFNALRFSDHALGHFFKLAKKSNYYKDTLFVVYADHGLKSFNPIQLSSFYNTHQFSVYHIPFLIHSPLLPQNLKGYRDQTLGFQPDILPTIQSMLGVEGPNSSFGLDLRSEEAKKRKGIFLRGSGAQPVRFFDGERIIYAGLEDDTDVKSFKTENFVEQLHALKDQSHFINEEESMTDDIKLKAELGRAYLKAIKYKLKNNQKSKVMKHQDEVLSSNTETINNNDNGSKSNTSKSSRN